MLRPSKDYEQTRCPWCLSNAIYMKYHDTEWGLPVLDDQKQFEFLCWNLHRPDLAG
jgi:3-methyladenine DNA glycosylase Tag